MEVKSPFRLWLDSEGSESSLPSPRLVERLEVPSPLLLGASDSTEQREESRREGALVRLRLQFARERKPNGGERAVSPICNSASPLRMKRLTRRRPDFPIDSSRKQRSSTANRKLFISTKHPSPAVLFTPTSPKSLNSKSVHLTCPKLNLLPSTLHPYLTIASPHKRVEVLARARLYFPSPKGEARHSVKSKETTGFGKRRRSVTPLSLLGGKRVG